MICEHQKIIEHYGYEHQLQKLVEELRELESVILYDTDNIEHIKEEMADVLNLINQIMIYKGWHMDIFDIEVFKVNRQLERIKDEIKHNNEGIG